MIKNLFFFLIFWLFVATTYNLYRASSGKEKLELALLLFRSFLAAAAAAAILTTIVILF